MTIQRTLREKKDLKYFWFSESIIIKRIGIIKIKNGKKKMKCCKELLVKFSSLLQSKQ